MGDFLPTISAQDLKPGVIAEFFSQGSKVVILKDLRILELWKDICEKELYEGKNNPGSQVLNDSIFDISGNHVSNNMTVGDMLRFTPGEYAHFARKVKIFPSIEENRMEKFPASYSKENGAFIYSEEVLRKVWQVVSEIVVSMFPPPNGLPNYAVNIETLRYPKSVKELKDLFSLIEDSSGVWSKLGHRLDSHKIKAKGIFNHRFLRDCFAFGSLIPGVKFPLKYLNDHVCNNAEDLTPENTVVIGGDHIDGTKVFSCLAGDRDNLITQIYSEGKWIDLPLDSQSVAIFPGKLIAKINKISPTRHRILMKKTQDPSRSKANISMIFTITPR